MMHSSLDAILADILVRLGEGASNRKSPLHTPVVGTADGGMRVMVLRHLDAERGILRFHTDARSPKVAAIGAGAPASILLYDPDAKIQVRASGQGRIEIHGPTADQAWSDATNFAKRCYLAEAAPGSRADGPASGLPDAMEGVMPTDADLVPARANFAVLLVELQQLDWLYLANAGHRRAIFQREPTGWLGRWVIP